MTELRRPKGTYDILPPASHAWRRAQRIFDELAEAYGYGLVLTPLFEPTEVFARGVGADTEVVEKQMYTFEDQGGRSLTLRPEATASTVRAAIQSGLGDGVLKAAYWGPMFRYERPQKGRNRQFYQAGVEYLGSPSPEADVEVIEFGYRFLERVGVENVVVHLNSIGDTADRVRYREKLTAFLRSVEDRLSEDARRRIPTNPLRVLDSKVDGDVVTDAPVPIDHLGDEAAAHFAEVRSGLDALGIPYEIDDKLVRGLDYYNRTVFEYIPTGYEAAQSAAGGGGRYDGLFETLGGSPTPGVGLAMGIDRIMIAAGEQEVESLDAFVVSIDGDRRKDARTLVSRLRQAGIRTDITDRQRSVKAQFRAADRLGARFVVVVGDEWDDGNVTVRTLSTGDQDTIDMKEIEAWLRSR